MMVLADFIAAVVIAQVVSIASSLTLCPDSWLPFNGSCYFFLVGKPMTFYAAEAYCRNDHQSHLVEITTAAENHFVKDFLTKLKADSYWLGTSDKGVNGAWRWYISDDLLTFNDWFPGQPSTDNGHDQGCGILDSSHAYRWADRQCHRFFEAVCEIRATTCSDAILG